MQEASSQLIQRSRTRTKNQSLCRINARCPGIDELPTGPRAERCALCRTNSAQASRQIGPESHLADQWRHRHPDRGARTAQEPFRSRTRAAHKTQTTHARARWSRSHAQIHDLVRTLPSDTRISSMCFGRSRERIRLMIWLLECPPPRRTRRKTAASFSLCTRRSELGTRRIVATQQASRAHQGEKLAGCEAAGKALRLRLRCLCRRHSRAENMATAAPASTPLAQRCIVANFRSILRQWGKARVASLRNAMLLAQGEHKGGSAARQSCDLGSVTKFSTKPASLGLARSLRVFSGLGLNIVSRSSKIAESIVIVDSHRFLCDTDTACRSQGQT